MLVDQVSRACIGFAVFRATPNSTQVQQFLDRAIRASGHTPRYVVTDRGRQFDCRSFKRWCKRRQIRPRYGVLGEPSSICIVERFIRSLKDQCTRRLIVPFATGTVRRELAVYASWYNRWRPHTSLAGRTPDEAFTGRRADQRRYEVRPRYPALRHDRLQLDLGCLEGRRHLPVIALRRAA